MKKTEKPDCHVKVGDRVRVTEPGIRSWTGTVRAVKWSMTSGWWAEILRDKDDGMVWSVRADIVKKMRSK